MAGAEREEPSAKDQIGGQGVMSLAFESREEGVFKCCYQIRLPLRGRDREHDVFGFDLKGRKREKHHSRYADANAPTARTGARSSLGSPACVAGIQAGWTSPTAPQECYHGAASEMEPRLHLRRLGYGMRASQLSA